jgi:hypothetical protein
LEAATRAATAAAATVATVAGLGADLLGAGAPKAPAPEVEPEVENETPKGDNMA